MSPRPSDVNDEAADLRASAAARRVAQVPLHKISDDLPRHFLLPAQGNPDLWAVRVKVRCTFQIHIQRLMQFSTDTNKP